MHIHNSRWMNDMDECKQNKKKRKISFFFRLKRSRHHYIHVVHNDHSFSLSLAYSRQMIWSTLYICMLFFTFYHYSYLLQYHRYVSIFFITSWERENRLSQHRMISFDSSLLFLFHNNELSRGIILSI